MKLSTLIDKIVFVKNKSLIIQTAFLGDLILTEPLIRIVRERLKIIPFVLIRKGLEELMKFMDGVEVITIKKGLNLSGTLSILRKVMKEGFDFVFSPHRSFRSALIARGAINAVKIGFSNSEGFWFYDMVVPYEGEHEVKRILSLLTPVEKENFGIIPPALRIREIDIENGRRILKTKGIEEGFIAVFPGSKWNTKRWLPEGFVGLIHLLKKSGFSPVIFGSADERELCEKIAKETGVKNLAGETSIEELPLALFHARAIISNDSAPVHLASALDKPVVAIFGPTHPSLGFYPLSKKSAIVQNEEIPCRPCGLHGGRSCPEKHFLCMKTISYHQVYSALLSVL